MGRVSTNSPDKKSGRKVQGNSWLAKACHCIVGAMRFAWTQCRPCFFGNTAMNYRHCTLLAQFSIRDLLWLIVVSALAFAWLREHALMEHVKATFATERESDTK